METGTAAVSVRGVSMTYPGPVHALQDIDLDFPAGQLTSLRYTNGTSTIGDLGYTYDAVGRRASMTGSLARTTLPDEHPKSSTDIPGFSWMPTELKVSTTRSAWP